MEQTLSRFVKALRQAEVRVSTAETLDALAALRLVGYSDRHLLKNTLATVLAKSETEKYAFDECFERFFSFQHWQSQETENAAEDTFDHTYESLAGNDLTQTQTPSDLAQLLLNNDRAELNTQMVTAASAVNLDQITLFTQRALYTQRIMGRLGLDDLNTYIRALQRSDSEEDQQQAEQLAQRRTWLREQVRDYVEQQFLLYADVNGQQLRQELLYKAKLANIDQHYYKDLQQLIQSLAKKLIALHSRRKKRQRRGQLNMSSTLRHNMAYDGMLFELHWKAVKIDRPKVFAICDVSGSVSSYARFMLMFLYSLEELLPKVRAFAFSSYLGEVTDLFSQQPLTDAVGEALLRYGGGSTDYGQAWLDFTDLCLNDIDQRSTIIILGDGRNNYGQHRAELLQQLYQRCQRLIWLNPEPQNFWAIGDAEMTRYSAYCHHVEQCNSLRHLERVISNLLRVS